MSTATSLLDRLTSATSYQELQAVFTEIVSQAQAKPEDPELARTIDEVVRRLEQERARDEQELREIQSQYASFQSQHQGVVGWFKRHLPFTETRRQEVEHRGEVADQQAEILADNLVIARAQMIKERLLGPTQRKLGRRAPEWRARFDTGTSQPTLANLGETLKELASEVERSGHFVRELKEDLDAFAGAAFKSEDDCRRRDADLATARQELAALQREVEEETALQTSGLAEVCRRAAEELSRTSVPFQEDSQRQSRLKSAAERLKETGESFDRLHKAAKEVGAKARQLLDLPAEVQRSREALLKIQARQAAAAGEAERKSAIFNSQRDQYERARQDQQQKQQLLASAQQFYDAWQAERQASGASSPEAETSPVAWRFQEAQTAMEQAEAELRRISPSHEAALKETETAQKGLDAVNQELNEARQKIAALEEKVPQLRMELASEVDRCQPLVATAAAALSSYDVAAHDLETALRFQPHEFAAGTYGWLGPRGMQRSFGDALLQAQTDYARHQQALAILDRLIKWQGTVDSRLSQEQKAVRERRESLWRRRCREVLGDVLAQTACREGLA